MRHYLYVLLKNFLHTKHPELTLAAVLELQTQSHTHSVISPALGLTSGAGRAVQIQRDSFGWFTLWCFVSMTPRPCLKEQSDMLRSALLRCVSASFKAALIGSEGAKTKYLSKRPY